jgi:glutamine synthetase
MVTILNITLNHLEIPTGMVLVCMLTSQTSVLRTCGSKETYEKICEAFRPVTAEHIAVYGAYNEQRLTGKHETASIHDFSYGVSDRGCSIRIPLMTVQKGWKGWLEDRRPASNGDPYKIAARIIKTVKSAL